MVEIGQIYMHTKRGDYFCKIIALSLFQCGTYPELDYKEIVLYTELVGYKQGDVEKDFVYGKSWSRMTDEFLEEVEIEGVMKPRFQLVN